MVQIEGGSGVLPGIGDLQLFEQWWLPAASPRAAIVLVHGYGEHSDRYPNLIKALVPQGYAIHTFDLRGHGRSPGKRGHILAWEEYIGDLSAFVIRVRREHPDLPLFLYGHSMGGLIALEYAERYPDDLAGVIASAPAFGPLGVSRALLALGRLLSHLWPSFTIERRGNPEVLSRDPDVIAAAKADTLMHGRASARFSSELETAMRRTLANAGQLHLPLLILHGTADRLVYPQGSAAFYERAASADKTRLTYEGGHHEPHNDINAVDAMNDVLDWLNIHAERRYT